MTTPGLLLDGPDDAGLTIALAHGAGSPMDSPFMTAYAEGLAAAGFRVARFEFPYMAERRRTGRKRPPDRAPILTGYWEKVIAVLGAGDLIIGGKSMGGRMASMVADASGVRGLVCLGYPFHAPGRAADEKRLGHMAGLTTPALIVQGTRDALGRADEVGAYTLSLAIKLHWLEDGDHSFKPRRASGRTEAQNWDEGIAAVVDFARAL